MMNDKKHILNNILIILLFVLVSLFIYSTYGTYKLFSLEQKKMQVFYITDAGINQAIWYLSTPENLGGYGPYWRTKGLTKFHSIGKYSISVIDGVLPGEIKIISTGEAKGMIQMATVTVVTGRSLPRAFGYALYSDNKLYIKGDSYFNGSIYCNDNLIIEDETKVLSGKVYVSPGNSIERSGNTLFEKGKAIRPIPIAPVLDTTFYYEKITRAKSGYPSVIKGDKVLKNASLNGKTLYVKGNVTINGNIKGPGIIVSTRNIFIEGKGKLSGSISIISNGTLKISGDYSAPESVYLYSRQKLEISDDASIRGIATYISPTKIEVGKNCNLCGLIFAPETLLGENMNLRGSIVSNNFADGIIKNVNITHDNKHLPLTVVGFNVGSNIVMKKPGTWKEIKI